ncbi:MAG TPA: hypothetical protein VFV34_27345 [Blastocatellia bacterium]|nr:hypothetical protein [Blastocatellia bacterium]
MRITLAIMAVLLGSSAAAAQAVAQQPPSLDDVAITPSRHELIMAPGTERTVVVDVIYTSESGKSAPARLVAYLNDWAIDKSGTIQFYAAGAKSDSATSWVIHSPVELQIAPGSVTTIRVTVTVPKDATPGDHTAALILEPRPDVLKTDPTRKRLQTRFRLAAIFYIMVPDLTRKASLQNLRAETSDKGIVVIPRIRNEGNTHVRPIHSIKIVDQAGVIAAEISDTEWLPVLGGTETELRLLIEKAIPPGNYSVRYRVNFADGNALTEGQTELTVREHGSSRASNTPPNGDKNLH